MKRLFLAGAIALFGLANAQVNFGIKAGYTHSKAYFENLQEQPDYKSGFYGGFFTEYNLGKRLSLEGSLLYSNVGFKIENASKQNYGKKNPLGDPYYTAEYNLRLNTLAVPISLKYNIGAGLSVFGGVNLGYVFSANLTDIKKYDIRTELRKTENENYSDMVNKFSAAPFLGVAYNLSDNLFIEADYNYGVTSIYDSSEGLKGYSRFLQVGLGYKF